jgi:Zn-finger nucleic acid-binding protein
MTVGAIAAAAVASGMSNAKKGETWHQLNKANFKERKNKLKEKYKNILSKNEVQLIESITENTNLPDLPQSSKQCPECQANFNLIEISGLEIDCCCKCKSFWFDSGELKDFTGLEEDVPASNLTSRASKYSCPICKKKMTEFVFLQSHNLLVDCCELHGVYLEQNELGRVVELSSE